MIHWDYAILGNQGTVVPLLIPGLEEALAAGWEVGSYAGGTVLLRRVIREPRTKFVCKDCGAEMQEDYALKDAVWKEVVPGGKGLFHLTCMEKRLGRKLRPDDFKRGWWANALMFHMLKNAKEGAEG